MRFGYVAILGRSNVGKTTLLNRVLGENLAVVTPVAQTTRDVVLGVVHRTDAQIAFLDTPGIHRPKSELGRRMNLTAMDAVRAADVVLLMTDLSYLRSKPGAASKQQRREASDWIHPDDIPLLESIASRPAVLVVNKVDTLRNKDKLLPLLSGYSERAQFRALLPISAHEDHDIERVLEVVSAELPEGEAGFAPDTLTDQPASFFAKEYIREQILIETGREVPHASAITIDHFDEGPRLARINATVHVEKVGQRKILIGTGGATIRAIGTGARKRIEALLEKKVHLELFVRVTARWRSVPRQLAELGYAESATPTKEK